jgi:hypothetical protein
MGKAQYGRPIDIMLKIECLMACTNCLVCLVSTVFVAALKNTLRRASTSSRLITKLEQSTFLRYLRVDLVLTSFDQLLLLLRTLFTLLHKQAT